MTTRCIRHARSGSVKHRVKTLLEGDEFWLRPIRHSVRPMIELTEKVLREGNDNYLEFMIHSSELMPGGSIYFETEEAVEKLYETMDQYFSYVKDLGFQAGLLRDVAQI